MGAQKSWQLLKNILPWFVAAGIFAYLFYLYPPHKVWNALQHVRLSTFIPFAIGYFLFIYFVDLFSLTTMFRQFGFNVRVRELILARGATYLFMVFNYAAAQLGFAYYLKKGHGIPIWEALSIFFFFIVIDLYWIITLSFIGSFFQDYQFGGVEIKKGIWIVTFVAYLLFILNLLFWRGPIFKKLEKLSLAPLHWIRKKEIFRIFKEAKLKDYLILVLLRTPIHISLMVSMYIVLNTFGVFTSFLKILGSVPLAILVGTIPITPGGLGTSNATMVELLSPHLKSPIFEQDTITPAELLLAASLLWMFSNYFLKTVVGAFCLKKVSKDLWVKPPGEKREVTHLGQNLPI